jgi:exodeoxyribonuclease VIII
MVEGMSYHDYAAAPGLRASFLAALDRGCPAVAEYERTHPADSKAMRLGRALHSMILEPETFAEVYTIGGSPVNPRTNAPYGPETKAYLEWEAAQVRPIITTEEHRLVLGMAESVAAHPVARTIRDGPRQCELSLFWEQEGIPCKARLDCLQMGERARIWDIKTCRDAGYRGFERAMADYRYHMAAAWYAQGLQVALAPAVCQVQFLWLAVENTPPYALAVYEACLDLLQVGYDKCAAAVELYKTCSKEKHWPAYYAKEAVLMAAPRWMLPDDFGG